MSRPEAGCAIVTGGSRGIGAASARALAADGWPVVVGYRADEAAAQRTVAAIGEAGGSALAIQADVREPADRERLFEQSVAWSGPVLCLVNNAGIRADGLAVTLSDEDWSAVLDTNLGAAFDLMRRALRPMIRARYGRIVNISSVVGARANPGQANYAAAKAGLIGLTKTVAAEVARKGVTVNAVAPGFIDTDLTADVPAEVKQHVPAGRPGTPEEVGACVRFLASDGATYVTGTTLFVDGGLAA